MKQNNYTELLGYYIIQICSNHCPPRLSRIQHFPGLFPDFLQVLGTPKFCCFFLIQRFIKTPPLQNPFCYQNGWEEPIELETPRFHNYSSTSQHIFKHVFGLIGFVHVLHTSGCSFFNLEISDCFKNPQVAILCFSKKGLEESIELETPNIQTYASKHVFKK